MMEHISMTTVNDGTNDESGILSITGGGNGGEGGGGGGGGGVEEAALKKGPWTAAEDAILIDYVTKHGEGNWNAVQRNTGLARCGKSCRLRWANHLRPNLKKGAFSSEEEKLIVELHAQFGNKWARMAALLPGRTDNEIKNYWNTRVKRRQRQGLPLYSDDHDHPTTPTTPTTPSPCVTPTGSNTNNVTKFDFLHQNHHHHHHNQLSPTAQQSHHSPLSSPLQHRQPQPSYNPASSYSNSPSPFSFTFQRPTPVLGNPLRFKRYRSSPNFNLHQVHSITPYSPASSDPPMTTQMSDFDSFRFPIQHNSSYSSQYFQTPLLDSDRMVSSQNSVFSSKMELPSNQYSQPEVKLEMEFNDPSLQTSSGMLGDLLFEAQALASGQNSKKRNYLSLNEGNDMFDGCQSFEDWPLNSTYWSSTSGLKPKEEASEQSKSMNEDYSKLLTVMPSSMQGTEWHNNNSTGEVSYGQSSGVMSEDNFGHDVKPIASLFPLTNTTNHNENQGYYSWDNLPGLC